MFFSVSNLLIILAGTPATITKLGRLFVTTEPAPIITPSPIETPGNMEARSPIQTLLPIITGLEVRLLLTGTSFHPN